MNPPNPLGSGIWLREAERLQAAIESTEMRVELERFTVVSPDDFVHAVTKLEPPVVDRDRGLRPGNESTVQKSDIRHRA
jgi:hypothetical protein